MYRSTRTESRAKKRVDVVTGGNRVHYAEIVHEGLGWHMGKKRRYMFDALDELTRKDFLKKNTENALEQMLKDAVGKSITELVLP